MIPYTVLVDLGHVRTITSQWCDGAFLPTLLKMAEKGPCKLTGPRCPLALPAIGMPTWLSDEVREHRRLGMYEVIV